MFSANNKISVKQTKYLLLLDWIARLVMLLPVCLSGKTVGSAVFCVVAGTAVWWLLLNAVLSWVNQKKAGEQDADRGNLTDLKEAAGIGGTFIFCFAGALFFLVQAAVFLNLTASVCSVCLLPEVPVPLICLLPAAAAVLLGAGSIEVQGRFCEVIGPVVVTVLSGLIFFAAFGMKGYVYEETMVQLSDQLASGSFEVFACLGGLYLPLIGGHLNDELPAHTVKKGGLAAAVIGGGLCAVTIGSYGKNGMLQMEFPAVRVMSNLRLPGVFLQRWDVLFLAFLLVCLTVTVAESLWGVKELLGNLWELGAELQSGFAGHILKGKKRLPPEEKTLAIRRRTDFSWYACIFLVYLAAAGFLSQWTAIGYYRALNLQLLTPAIFLFYIIAGFIRKRNASVKYRRSLILVLLVLVSAFFLGGCTAYEPEERLFPMAMEIRVEDGQLVMAYAWNEGAGPGSVSAAEAEETEAEERSEEAAARVREETEEEKSAEKTETEEEKSTEKTETETASGGKFAETRDGITIFRGKSLGEIQEKTTAFSERYMDYSHVKAILLDQSLREALELEQAVIDWLAKEPAFASGLIIYRTNEETFALEQVQRQAGGQVGKYLENLYENNEAYRARSTTLGELIAEYYA